MRHRPEFLIRCLFTAMLWLCAMAAGAHTIRPSVVDLTIEPDNTVSITARVNAEVLLARIDPKYSDTNDSPNAAEYDRLRALPPSQLARAFAGFADEFVQQVRLDVDGRSVPLSYAGIDVENKPDLELARDSRVRLTGKLPENAQQLIWVWPEAYGSNVLRIRRGDSIRSTWLKLGEQPQPYVLNDAPATASRIEVALNYVVIGFEHIVPKGLDHILFVLGIFLLSTRLGPLLWQVTAFTVAHTITLGLSIYGLISAPPSIVEPLIALSIAYVGIENCLSPQLKPWRVVLVFLFGLLHGMGFAGVLSEIGLPPSEFVTALITFNVGVELGQLAVILAAFLVLGWWRNEPWYRARIVIPLSLAISAIGLYWTVERVMG